MSFNAPACNNQFPRSPLGYPEGAMDTRGYTAGEASATTHKRTQGEVVPPQRCLPLLLRTPLVWDSLFCPSVYFHETCCNVLFFGVFQSPVKKVTAGNQKNKPVKSHKSHFLRKIGKRWPSKAWLCIAVIPATARRSRPCY